MPGIFFLQNIFVAARWLNYKSFPANELIPAVENKNLNNKRGFDNNNIYLLLMH